MTETQDEWPGKSKAERRAESEVLGTLFWALFGAHFIFLGFITSMDAGRVQTGFFLMAASMLLYARYRSMLVAALPYLLILSVGTAARLAYEFGVVG